MKIISGFFAVGFFVLPVAFAADPEDLYTRVGSDPSPAELLANGTIVWGEIFSTKTVLGRGGATLSLQHSSDLGISDPWTTVVVPDTSPLGPESGVTFTVTENDPINTVTATISATEAAGGKLFGRLVAD